MRLINTSTLQLEDFIGLEVPKYAILSHTWGTDEVNLQEFTSPTERTKSKKGFDKILRTCSLAQKDELDYAWVDTCCIDKTSSAELTESINSMFEWYKRSTVCYTYLSDVPPRDPSVQDTLTDEELVAMHEELTASRWFTRGWTLQELIAPEHQTFFDQSWNLRGNKGDLVPVLSQITRIDEDVLRDREKMAFQSVAVKMSWASARETTRLEDTAYCLLGIFNVNMPLLYGEGANAFTRLQHEILKSSTDLSIFGWCTGWTTMLKNQDTSAPSNEQYEDGYCSILAQSPKEFGVLKVEADTTSLVEFTVTNLGIHINCSLIEICMNGCEPLSRCQCDPESPKYLFKIPDRGNWAGPCYRGWGVLLEKIRPDYFIRSSSGLVHIHFSRAGRRGTRRRPIYFSTTAAPRLGLGIPDMFRSIALQAPDLVIGSVVPESRWDFSKRRFFTLWLSEEHSWGLVEFRIPKEQLQYASHDIRFCILFEALSRGISFVGDHKTTNEIFRDGEEWTFEDVFEQLRFSRDVPQEPCHNRMVREFEFLDRRQSKKYKKRAQVVAEISGARFDRLDRLPFILTVKFKVV